ncbi:hypothetical protein Goshw_006687, partial [Gossypium schwendimanii]|nr:hypothetical protein [Gossypium schwendimanii]
DLRQTEWTRSTLAHVDSKDYDVFLLLGDLSYADTHKKLWDSFVHKIEFFPWIRRHTFKAYNACWLMPYKESGSTSNLYYSFDIASSHIVVVVVHVSWYNTNSAHKGEGESMRKAMEELLYKARVDIAFVGHIHAYERLGEFGWTVRLPTVSVKTAVAVRLDTTRIYDKKPNPCGPVYITMGDGGNPEGLALKFEGPTSELSLYREPSFGHGRLRVVDESRAHWSWHRNNDSQSLVAHQVWLQSLPTIKPCWLTTVHKDGSYIKNDEL